MQFILLLDRCPFLPSFARRVLQVATVFSKAITLISCTASATYKKIYSVEKINCADDGKKLLKLQLH